LTSFFETFVFRVGVWFGSFNEMPSVDSVTRDDALSVIASWAIGANNGPTEELLGTDPEYLFKKLPTTTTQAATCTFPTTSSTVSPPFPFPSPTPTPTTFSATNPPTYDNEHDNCDALNNGTWMVDGTANPTGTDEFVDLHLLWSVPADEDNALPDQTTTTTTPPLPFDVTELANNLPPLDLYTEEEAIECTICYEGMQMDNADSRFAACGHGGNLCEGCNSQLLQCPYCRVPAVGLPEGTVIAVEEDTSTAMDCSYFAPDCGGDGDAAVPEPHLVLPAAVVAVANPMPSPPAPMVLDDVMVAAAADQQALGVEDNVGVVVADVDTFGGAVLVPLLPLVDPQVDMFGGLVVPPPPLPPTVCLLPHVWQPTLVPIPSVATAPTVATTHSTAGKVSKPKPKRIRDTKGPHTSPLDAQLQLLFSSADLMLDKAAWSARIKAAKSVLTRDQSVRLQQLRRREKSKKYSQRYRDANGMGGLEWT
jgi:hypothetical protein